MGLPDPGDTGGGGDDLARLVLGKADKAEVECGAAAVAAHLQHVVGFGGDHAEADAFGTLPEILDVAGQVGGGADDRSFGRPLMRPARQPQGPDQVSQAGDLPASGRVPAVHRVPGGQHRDQAAGPGQAQALDDEMVMDRMASWVVRPVVQHDPAERHIADHQVKAPILRPRLGERLGPDLRPRIQVARDRGGHRIKLHSGQLRRTGRQADEVAAPAPRLQHPPAGKAQRLHRRPHCLDDGRVGVVSVQRVPGSRL